MTRKGFKRFLAEHPDSIFRTKTPWHCPLAEYVKAEHNTETASVTSSEYDYEVRGRRYCHGLPVWAQAFVAHVDGLKDGHEPEITAQEAQAVLDGVAA